MHFRHSLFTQVPLLERCEGFFPAGGAETPLVACGHAGGGEVVALFGGEVEEFLRDGRCDGVVARVGGVGAAVAVFEEAGAFGEEAQAAVGD
jgi:hypothetical protein